MLIIIIKVGHGALLPRKGNMVVVATDGWWPRRHIREGKGYKRKGGGGRVQENTTHRWEGGLSAIVILSPMLCCNPVAELACNY